MNNKLQITEIKQMQPWVKHFFIHVVKRCAKILIAWIEEFQEIDRGIDQTEAIRYNGQHKS